MPRRKVVRYVRAERLGLPGIPAPGQGKKLKGDPKTSTVREQSKRTTILGAEPSGELELSSFGSVAQSDDRQAAFATLPVRVIHLESS